MQTQCPIFYTHTHSHTHDDDDLNAINTLRIFFFHLPQCNSSINHTQKVLFLIYQKKIDIISVIWMHYCLFPILIY